MLSKGITNNTLSKKARLKQLAEQLERMEATAARQSPIEVIHCRGCSHPECGQKRPRSAPADALIVYLGCIHESPTRNSTEDLRSTGTALVDSEESPA